MPERDWGGREFIGWLPEFDCHVSLIDHQHRGILGFINAWYVELKERRVAFDNLAYYLLTKFEFLDAYSKAHLGVEEKMLEILARDHGFAAEERRRHLAIHQRFIKEFMGSLADQVSTIGTDPSPALLENLASEGLKDVARWWYTHIKTPSPKLPAGPDHIYRVHLRGLSAEAKVALLDDLILAIGKGSPSNDSAASPAALHA